MFEGITNLRIGTIESLVASENEPKIKQFLVSDVDGDPTNIYYAQAAARSGEECIEQVIQYTASGVKTVEKIAWRKGIWSGDAWDII